MSLAASQRYAGPYTATAAQTDFDCAFPVIDPAGIFVQRIRAGLTTILSFEGADFTIVDETAGGFTVRLAAGSTVGDQVTPYSNLAAKRDQTIGTGAIDGPALETSLEYLTALDQEAKRDVLRAVLAPFGQTPDGAADPTVAAEQAQAAAAAAEAAATEAVAAAASMLPNDYTSLAAATTMNIGVVTSSTIRVTGQTTLDVNSVPAQITSLGPCAVGDPVKVLIFDDVNNFNCDGVHLVWGAKTFFQVLANGKVTATPIATNKWHLEPSADCLLQSKFGYWDQEDFQHQMAIQFGSPNKYDSFCPSFLHNGSNNVQKTWVESIFVNGAIQSGQIGMWYSGGTPEVPTAVGAGFFSHMFNYVYDGTSFDGTNGLNAMNDASGLNHNQYYQYSSRPVQILLGNYEAPTATTRSGYYCINICAQGSVSPTGHLALTPGGSRISFGKFGRTSAAPNWNYAGGATATYEYPIPWTDHEARGLSSGPGRRDLFPSGGNPAEVAETAQEIFFAVDKGTFPLRHISPSASQLTGVVEGYDATSGGLAIGFRSGGSNSWSVLFNPTGYLEPMTNGGAGLGETTRRWGSVNALSTDTARGSNGTVHSSTISAVTFTSDIHYMEATAAASAGTFNFLRMRVMGSTYARIDGTGKGWFDGGTATSGAGFGEMFEWLDGNPGGEDRSGWSVCAVGDKIDRASAHPELAVIGTISRRLAHVGDAAAHRHHRMFETDRWGRRVTDPVEYLEWHEPQTETATALVPRLVTETVTRAKTETAIDTHTTQAVKVVDGKHVLQPQLHRDVVTRAATELQPLHDADGQPLTKPVTRHAPDANGELQPVYGPDGLAIVDQVPVMHPVPVMETVEEQRWIHEEVETQVPAAPRLHHYRADAVPEGVTVPADAQRVTVQEPRLHPDFKPELSENYVSREDRAEWDGVSYLGKELILKGERTGANWIKLRDVDDVAEEWLVFPPAPAAPELNIAQLARLVAAQLAAGVAAPPAD